MRDEPVTAASVTGKQRSRLALMAASGSLVFRVVSIASTILATAVAARDLTPGELTLWFVLLSLTAFQGLADLGLMSELTSAVAVVDAQDREAAIQLLLGTTTRAALSISIPLFSFLAVVMALSGASSAFWILGVVMLLTIPLQGPVRVLHGLQRGAVANIAAALAQVLLLAALVACWAADALTMPRIVFLTTAAPMLGGLGCLIALHRTTSIRWTLRITEALDIRASLRRSSSFLVIAVASAVAFSTDSIVLSLFQDDQDVAQYSIVYRLFTQGPIFVYFFATGLWPAVADALRAGDADWFRFAIRRSLIMAVTAIGSLSISLIFLANEIIRFWAGPQFLATPLLLVAAACYAVVHAVWSPLHFTLVGLGQVTFVARSMAAMALANIAVSIPLAIRLGAPGPILGSAATVLVFLVIPYFLAYRRASLQGEHALKGP
jgi:O-antigen/teichoic acid export membrane protein